MWGYIAEGSPVARGTCASVRPAAVCVCLANSSLEQSALSAVINYATPGTEAGARMLLPSSSKLFKLVCKSGGLWLCIGTHGSAVFRHCRDLVSAISCAGLWIWVLYFHAVDNVPAAAAHSWMRTRWSRIKSTKMTTPTTSSALNLKSTSTIDT